jgi:hypothetical protein
VWFGVLGIGGVKLLIGGVDAGRAHFAGITGTVTVSACTPHTKDFRQVGWDCSGSFVSDDGGVSIAHVDLFPYVDDQPTGPLPAMVTGADATTARPPNFLWWVPLAAGFVFLGVFAYSALRIFRRTPQDETGRRPSRLRVPGARSRSAGRAARRGSR